MDRFGNRANILTIVPIIMATVHLLLAFTDTNPILLMIIQGLGYCGFASAFWPSITLTVPAAYTGLCFGIASSMQNIGLSIVPMIVAFVYTISGNSYIPNVELVFICLNVLSFVTAIMILILDPSQFNRLNRTKMD